MKTTNFYFKFKENRDYVHGTDLFNNSIKFLRLNNLSDINKIDMNFHSIIRNQTNEFLYKKENIPDKTDYAFSLKFSCDEQTYFLLLNENQEKVTERYRYPESDITDLSEINPELQQITLTKEIDYTNIEKIVALNKALLENLFSDVQGKWYFSRLKLDTIFHKDAYSIYQITLKRNLNFKLTKSEIKLDGENVGYIYFSLK